MMIDFREKLAIAGAALTIAGCSSGLQQGIGLTAPGVSHDSSACGALQPTGSLHGIYVADYSDNRIDVLSICADGLVAPLRIIHGGDTGLFGPIGVGLDPNQDLYVSNDLGASIDEYAPGANGDAHPIATIAGSNTDIVMPRRLAMFKSRPYVTEADRVLEFGYHANGNVAPIREIVGSNTGLTDAQDIDIDASGRVYVVDRSSNAVLVFGPNANGNVAPQFVYAGDQTGLNGPTGITLDASGNVYLANRDGGDVLVFAPPGSNGNAPPIASFTTPSPRDICVDKYGSVYVLDPFDRNITVYKGSGTTWTQVRQITGLVGGAWSPDEFTLH